MAVPDAVTDGSHLLSQSALLWKGKSLLLIIAQTTQDTLILS